MMPVYAHAVMRDLQPPAYMDEIQKRYQEVAKIHLLSLRVGLRTKYKRARDHNASDSSDASAASKQPRTSKDVTPKTPWVQGIPPESDPKYQQPLTIAKPADFPGLPATQSQPDGQFKTPEPPSGPGRPTSDVTRSTTARMSTSSQPSPALSNASWLSTGNLSERMSSRLNVTVTANGPNDPLPGYMTEAQYETELDTEIESILQTYRQMLEDEKAMLQNEYRPIRIRYVNITAEVERQRVAREEK